ncbi:MAG: protein kinase [bacterium]|nr:protein kinase [bacterium]
MATPRTAPAPAGDFYGILEVSPLARPEVVRAAYLALMQVHHPDVGGGHAAAARINAAYEALSDATKRAAYDRARADIHGTVIGSYRVLEQIAEGAIGITYRGEHAQTKLPVCIKHCAWLDADANAILEREATLMWDLRHFAIPAIRDIIRLPDGRGALVMSYIPGPTVAQLVEKHRRLDVMHVTWIAQRVLNALAYLHDSGVVHGDLKPQNIIVQPANFIVAVVDYGLAMVKPVATSTNAGYSAYFSPPEQLTQGPLVPASDFYALGMTMLYTLAGMRGVERKDVPADVPDPICAFIRKLIVHDVLSRKFTAAALGEELMSLRVQCFGRDAVWNMKPLAI